MIGSRDCILHFMTCLSFSNSLLSVFFSLFDIADSIIGIRSNYNDQIVNSDKKTDLSSMTASTSNGDGKKTHSYVNQTPMSFDTNRNKSPQKKLEAANVHTIESTANTLVVPGKPPPTITVTPTDETADKIIDGMLDRISHDLDYLLNRTSDIPPAPPPPISTVPTHSNRSVHEVIIEEEPEET